MCAEPQCPGCQDVLLPAKAQQHQEGAWCLHSASAPLHSAAVSLDGMGGRWACRGHTDTQTDRHACTHTEVLVTEQGWEKCYILCSLRGGGRGEDEENAGGKKKKTREKEKREKKEKKIEEIKSTEKKRVNGEKKVQKRRKKNRKRGKN